LSHALFPDRVSYLRLSKTPVAVYDLIKASR
jgi:hypothetical protein